MTPDELVGTTWRHRYADRTVVVLALAPHHRLKLQCVETGTVRSIGIYWLPKTYVRADN